MKRVVITGMGAVTPLGIGFPASWEALLSGTCGIGFIEDRAVGRTAPASLSLPVSVAGYLKGFHANGHLDDKEVRRLDPFVHYAVAAAREAFTDAGGEIVKRKGSVKARTGVFLGSSRGGIGTLDNVFRALYGPKEKGRREGEGIRNDALSSRRLPPALMPATTVSAAASTIVGKLGLQGTGTGYCSACASGANAIGEAFRALRSGIVDVALAGGSEAPLCEICFRGYDACGALARSRDLSISRPFDCKREGFVLAEGACVLVIEEMEQAMVRGARIQAEIIGYGNCMDGLDLVRPTSEGEALAIQQALDEAALNGSDIDMIGAHGTSTILGDAVEAQALHHVFGERAGHIPVTAPKSATGHMLGASGAFEIALAAASLKAAVIPPTIHVTRPDKSLGLNIIQRATVFDLQAALVNSFGFGGMNVAIVLKKFVQAG